MQLSSMEDFSLVRSNSLDAGSGSDKELMSIYPDAEPTPAELAQCEAEVGTLLSIIAEVNKKMGSLKAPSEPGDLKPPPPSPLFPDLLSHRLVRRIPEKSTSSYVTSNPSLPSRGGSGVIWTELKGALTAVEDSINFRRSWAAPITSSDRDRPKEHLRAAQDSWAKADKILDEMEKEFGISCPSDVAKETFQEELVDQSLDSSPLQGELQRSHSISNVEDEKNKVGHQRAWRSAICSPSYRLSGPSGASSSFPCSPLLLRRAARAGAPFSPGADSSPLSLANSGSSCPNPIGLETEMERLNRYIEKLKARNERLTAALERKRAEFEQISVTLKSLEADCSAMHLALRNCEECEEAYGELLSLYEAQRQQSIPLQTNAAEAIDTQMPCSPSAQHGKMGSEELSTSFTTTDVTKEMETHTAQRTPDFSEREVALHELIERLKRNRAAIFLPKLQAGVEMNPDAGSPAGLRGGHLTKDNIKPAERHRDKTSLFHELITAREEMSDLRALIRLKEKELRFLEWSLVAQKSQEASGACIPESLRDELADCKTEQQRLCENAAKVCSEGDMAGLRTRPILKELQAVLQREQALKKRLALVYDPFNPTLADSAANRRDNDEHVARLTQAHSKALSSYRHIRRKYREQMWKLEQKLAAMMDSQHVQSGTPKTAGEDSEWRREETVL
ncbi:harmonin-binding protein USHBP1 isoform X2 [Dunckerocampus dactyliophorus]|uniref:harmonin-binding protein USHBP1 isoform X2 n=1 Tax=Dunckerocampus dactyliophorus TaxID=161453 RepID=UPI002404E01B|nr:harmonin-binding protein USHBP1 isoform X2 [Dunckerocampus dactyliophorus]